MPHEAKMATCDISFLRFSRTICEFFDGPFFDFKEMDCICFSRQLFLDFFGQVQRGIGAGEQENLFFFAQGCQELDGFFLALFVEADEDVVEDRFVWRRPWPG